MVNLANCGISKQASSAFQNPIIVFSLQHLIWLKRNTSLTFCRQQQTAGQPASQPASYSNLRRNYTIVLCTLSVPDNLRIQILVWPSHRRSPVEKERKKEGEERREESSSSSRSHIVWFSPDQLSLVIRSEGEGEGVTVILERLVCFPRILLFQKFRKLKANQICFTAAAGDGNDRWDIVVDFF